MLESESIMRSLSALTLCGTGAFSQLAAWLINNRDAAADMPLSEVAAQAQVSETTVFRLAQHLGYSGYREMRVALAELRGIARGQSLSAHWLTKDDPEPLSAVINNTINVHREILRATGELVDAPALRAAVEAIQSAKVVQVFGFGSSEGPVVDLYQRLVQFGLITCQYSDPHVLASLVANPPDGSLFFAISFSGQSRDVVDTLVSAKRRQMKSVLITSQPGSTAAQIADVVLLSAPPGSVGGSETVGSRISQLAIIDMICTGLALEHPRKNELLRNAAAIEREVESKRVSQSRALPANQLFSKRK